MYFSTFCQNCQDNSKGSFTRTANVTAFVSGTFDLFNVMCKQPHKNALNPFFNGTKNGDFDGTCKRALTITTLSCFCFNRACNSLAPVPNPNMTSRTPSLLTSIIRNADSVISFGNPCTHTSSTEIYEYSFTNVKRVQQPQQSLESRKHVQNVQLKCK